SRVSAGEWVLHGARGAGTTVHLLGSHDRRSWARAPGACGPRVLPHRVYFLSVAFFSAGALDGDFAIDVVGTMMWAYGVPFHITHGPPLVQSVGYASSRLTSVGRIMMCGPLTTYWLSAVVGCVRIGVTGALVAPASMVGTWP